MSNLLVRAGRCLVSSPSASGARCLVDEAEVGPCAQDETGGRLGLLERPGEQCARRVVDQRAHVRGDLRPGAAQPSSEASRHEDVLCFADASRGKARATPTDHALQLAASEARFPSLRPPRNLPSTAAAWPS